MHVAPGSPVPRVPLARRPAALLALPVALGIVVFATPGRATAQADPAPAADPAAAPPASAPPPAPYAPEQAPLPPPPRPGSYTQGTAQYPAATPSGYPAPSYGMPPSPGAGRAIMRAFSFSLGAGPGALIEPSRFGGDAELGFQHVVRIAFEFSPDWALYLSWEGVRVSDRVTREGIPPEDALWSQHAYLVGAQAFLLPRLHARGGFGLGNITLRSASLNEYDDRGLAIAAALGYDVNQGFNHALSIELAGSMVQYPGQTWSMAGVQVVLTLF